MYGPNFNTYNVHGLLHLTNDVRYLGNLDSFSAFPYESNMSIFGKYCRKPGQPLQQFSRRMTEIQNRGRNVISEMDSPIKVSVQHNTADQCPRYRNITFNRLLLSADTRDNCCLLSNGKVCIVFDIVKDNNSYLLAVKTFERVEDFYDIGIFSSALQVYKCCTLSNEISRVHFNEVCAKCYRMPLWNSISADDTSSDEEYQSETLQYIVVAISHSEQM